MGLGYMLVFFEGQGNTAGVFVVIGALTVIGMLCTIMLSPVIGGLIAAKAGSWRAVVVATVIIGILALLACTLLYRESNQARDPLAGRLATLAGNYRALLKGAEVRAFSFAIAGTCIRSHALRRMFRAQGRSSCIIPEVFGFRSPAAFFAARRRRCSPSPNTAELI
eukprot:gene42689-52160_t